MWGFVFKHWLMREIKAAEREYREDMRLYPCDVTVLPYFCGRIQALKKVQRVLTGAEKGVQK
jgi:hypothetical protein